MMVMMPGRGGGFDMTYSVVAAFPLSFGFKRRVTDAVLGELGAHPFLDGVCIAAYDEVHGGIALPAVHRPGVHMVNVKDALHLKNMHPHRVKVDAVRCLFQKDVKAFLQVFYGVYEDKGGNSDGHEGIYDRKIGEFHHKGPQEYHDPTEHILQHMQIDRPLV